MFYIEKCKVYAKNPFVKGKRYKDMASHNNSIIEESIDHDTPAFNISRTKVPTLQLDKI